MACKKLLLLVPLLLILAAAAVPAASQTFQFSDSLSVSPGQPSALERAQAALRGGDFDVAAEAYRKWLAASPGDATAWYNFACVQALRGDSTAALHALRNAVTAGWADSSWTVRDPDLKPLHGMETFQNLTSRMARISRERETGAQQVVDPWFIERTIQSPYVLHLPDDYDLSRKQPYPLVMLLHERGGDHRSLVQLVERLALPGVAYALPGGGHAVERGEGFAWWERSFTRAPRDSVLLQRSRDLSAEALLNVAGDAAAREHLDTNRVVIVGVGQGAAMAMMTALYAPEKVEAVALLAASLPGDWPRDTALTARLDSLAAANVRVFTAHGTHDRLTSTDEMEAFLEVLVAAGVEVTSRWHPADHEATDEMVLDLADWLGQIFGRP